MNNAIAGIASVGKRFETEDECIEHLEKMRWPDGVRCLTCGNRKISRFDTAGKTGKVRHLYQCLEKSCRYQFSVTTGTIFHDSHLPLTKWFSAIKLVSKSKGEISANQLRHDLGIQYRTAQNVLQRIRKELEETGAASEQIELPARRSVAFHAAPRPQVAANLASRASHTDRMADRHEGRGPIDSALSIAASLAQMSIRPPLFFVSYITRILT